MGQKVNAVGMRIGVNRDWNSKWYANNQEFSDFLIEDVHIREYLEKACKDASVSHIEIQRKKNDKGHDVRVMLYVAHPGVVIGQDGTNATKIKNALAKLVAKDTAIHFDVVEVKDVDLDARLVANSIALDIENRASYRATQKKAIQRMRKAGAKGCRTLCSGRLGGAEIARREGYKEGVVPLHTVRADIDFSHVTAHTTYGTIGVKVWICRSLNKKADEEAEKASQAAKGAKDNAATEAR